jgi:hypothetical protein
MTPQPSSFTSKLYTYIPILEKILVAVLCVGVLLKYANIDGKPLIIISLSGLAGVFYLTSFKPVQIEREEGKKPGFKDLLAETILPKILGISCAVGTIAILFYLIGNQGYEPMTMIGGTAIAGALIVMAGLYATGTKNLEASFPMVLRAIPIMLLNVYIFMQHGQVI